MGKFYKNDTAIIDEGCTIGNGTKIWHFSHILSGSVIGENCIIGQNVMIGPGVKIGNNCKVQNNVSVYNGVELEENVFCGPSCVFTNVINPRANIEKKDEFLSTLVRKGATIGANATIVCGIELGEYCFIAAGSVVTKNVPAHALIVGVPGSQTGWVSRSGEKLQLPVTGDGSAVCPRTGESYTLINGICRHNES